MSPLTSSYIGSILGLESHQNIQKISKERKITSLWAGYGTINSVVVTITPKNEQKSLIIKRVNPPVNDNSVGNQRKIRSYHVEGFFYNQVAPVLIELKEIDESLPFRIAIPYSIEIESDSFTFILEDLSSDYSESYSSSISTINQTKQAIQWLAVLHASCFQHPLLTTITKNDENYCQVWEQGGYWHLQTRIDEWNSIPSYQSYFKKSAHAIDQRMNEIGNWKSHTLIHGDYKDANVLFGSNELNHCAAVDFQYCGLGYGSKDLVMWVVSSIPGSTFQKLGGEEGILKMYHEFLCASVEKIQKVRENIWEESLVKHFLDFENIKMQYELALVDYVRFMVGWGVWGANASYAEKRAVEILKDIAGSENNMKKFNDEEWKKAVYEKYPLDKF